MKGLDVFHLTKEVGEKTLESVIMRMKDDTGTSVVGGEFTWDLITPRSKLRSKGKMEGTPAP